jgi:hypothetical protein
LEGGKWILMADFQLPDLITLNDFGGDWDQYYDHIYQCFREDFLTKPLKEFNGKRIILKRYPITDDKEATFYHLTHEGSDEQSREPDLRRMERIRWIKYMMSNFDNPQLKVWRNKRGNNESILIYHEKENYLLVLADRGEYVMPWTAYMITYNNRKQSLLKEYHAYKKAEAAK